tara:strand:+ start:215 stop:703 length:489 start_codon:yes stop_codon:yes gene_type:complete
MSNVAVGNFLTLKSGSNTIHRYQNFFIGETILYEGDYYIFLPFGFSGVAVNRNGDGTDASLVFPNSPESGSYGEISRGWADEALRKTWNVHVRTLTVDPDDKTSFSVLCQYYGQVSTGGWNNTQVSLTINSVLDAVGSDVPQRQLTQRMVGDIPPTSNVRLQ